MAACHEKIVVANARFKPLVGATVNRDIFAEDIVLADNSACFFATELQVLREFAKHGAAVNHVGFAHFKRANQHRMWTDHASRTQTDSAIEDGIGPNLAILTHMGLGRDHRCWVDSG